MPNPLYQIPPRRFTDEAGNVLTARVERAAQDAFKNGILRADGRRVSFSTFEAAMDAFDRAARHEQWDIADKIARNAAHEAKLAADDAEARQIAATHNFNIETLSFEVERRKFGSFSLTPDGSPERRAIYARALEIARAEQRSHHLEAAA
jgi:hypothetical protein